MRNCLTSTTSWYAVWSSPYHVMLHEIWSSWCYAAWPLLDLIYFMLRCFTLPTSCQAAWCPQNLRMLFELVVMVLSWWIFSLPHAALPDPSYIMPICFIFPTSCSSVWSCFHDATLLDMIYFMLRCFTLPMSYKAAWHFCLHLWTCLHIATLLDRLYLTPHCLTLNYYVVLFALPSANHVFQLHGATLHDVICFMLPLH